MNSFRISRLINVDGARLNSDVLYPNNTISNSAFTLSSIIPLSLFNQFHNVAYLYFLLLCILEYYYESSIITLLPFCILISYQTCIDVYTWYPSIKNDQYLNRLRYKVWNGESFISVLGRDIHVGNIIILEGYVPADIVVLSSKNEKIYAKTYTRNTEVKYPIKETQKLIVWNNHEITGLKRLSGSVTVEEVNQRFAEFEGKLKLWGRPNSIKIHHENSLYRGSYAKCLVLGLVIYTGNDTKLSKTYKNSSEPSRIFKIINHTSIVFLAILAILLLSSVILSYENSSYESFFVTIFRFILLYGGVVPVSLFIVVHVNRILHFFFTRKSCKNVKILNPNSLEDLGRIEYVVVDDQCLILGSKIAKFSVGTSTFSMSEFTKEEYGTTTVITERADNYSFCKEETTVHRDFWEAAILSTSVVKLNEELLGPKEHKAMIKAAGILGVQLIEKTETRCTIRFEEKNKEFEIIGIHTAYNKHRALVRTAERVFLAVQGAPERMYHLLKRESALDAEDKVNEFSVQGLRSYLLAGIEINFNEAERIQKKLQRITSSSLNQKRKLEHFFSDLEKNLDYLGIVAVEDIISPEVFSSIDKLMEQNVSLCIVSAENKMNTSSLPQVLEFNSIISLEGLDVEPLCFKQLWKGIVDVIYRDDKRDEIHMETIRELNDSFSDNHLRFSETEKIISNHKIFRKFTMKPNDEFLERSFNGEKEYSVIIDKITLVTCLNNKDIRKLLVCVLSAANKILMYDISPDDKVSIIKLFQDNIWHRPAVLAMGWNAWSKGMIQEAAVGVSPMDISADICAPFHQIPNLLSQGAINYRVSLLSVIVMFFKNSLFAMILFSYQYFARFSAIMLFRIEYSGMFNLITSIQLISRNTSNHSILQYSVTCIVQIIFIVVTVIISSASGLTSNGFTPDLSTLGAMVYIILTSTIIIQIYSQNRSLVTAILAICLLIIAVYSVDGTEITEFPSDLICLTIGTLVCSSPGLLFSFLRNPTPFKTGRRFPYKSLKGVYRSTEQFLGENESLNSYKHSMKFKVKHVEIEYKQSYIEEAISFLRWILLLLSVIFLIWAVANYFLGSTEANSGIRFATSFIIFILLLTTYTNRFKSSYVSYLIIITIFSVLFKFILEVLGSSLSILTTILIPAVTYILFGIDWVYLTYVNLASLFLNIITICLYFGLGESAALSSIYMVSLVICLILTSAIVGYVLEGYYRDVYKLTQLIKLHLERTQSVLEILLPEFVIERVKAGVRYIAEEKEDITVLFCDICDFEKLCDSYSPMEFSATLDSIFSAFDQLCENFGVEKIETVGKTYMACTGLTSLASLESTPARVAVDLALSMLNEVDRIVLKSDKLHVKIGINTGSVIAGVVGFHKPQFSLVGDTVNTAARMCTTLETPNSIQISSSTRDALKTHSGLVLSPSQVLAKGKGMLDTFIVTESRNLEAPLQLISLSSINHKPLDWRRSVMERDDTEIIRGVWTTNLRETRRQKEYRVEKAKSKYWCVLLCLAIACAEQVILIVLEAVAVGKGAAVAGLVCRLICLATILPVMILHNKLYTLRYYSGLLLLPISALLGSSIVSLSAWNEIIPLVELCFILLLLNYATSFSISSLILLNTLVLTGWILASALITEVSITSILLLVSFDAINLSGVYRGESKYCSSYNLRIQSDKEIRETENLLVQMMPAHVVHSISEGSPITERLGEITLLFADIVGFTAWSAGKTPRDVVQMLSNMFTEFDKRCVELGVYKVHTIGDCYVVMGYLSGKRDPSTECRNVVRMAFSMIKIIEEENEKYGMSLGMRIGVHTGEIIAGVIGNKVVRYDIWGANVLIANKMESNGKAGEVNVSETTKAILEAAYPGQALFEYNKDIGKSPSIRSYFVQTTMD